MRQDTHDDAAMEETHDGEWLVWTHECPRCGKQIRTVTPDTMDGPVLAMCTVCIAEIMADKSDGGSDE